MLIAKLTIRYERGLQRNRAEDLKQVEEGKDAAGFSILGHGGKTGDGKIIRGLGTHFRSEEDARLVGERDKEARRIYKAFRERFLTTPIDGLYAVPTKGMAKAFLDDLNVQLEIDARVTEFEITTNGDLDAAEIAEWSKRIKNQLASVSLGRSKEVDESGLRALDTLASCPVISRQTAAQVKKLIELLRSNKISRIDLKRNIETMDVEIETSQLSPRRSPSLVGAA